MLTKNAIGNLKSRYKAVLKKCNLLNTFGSLAIAGMMVMGAGVGLASADTVDDGSNSSAVTDTVIDGVYNGFTGDGNILGSIINASTEALHGASLENPTDGTNGTYYLADEGTIVNGRLILDTASIILAGTNSNVLTINGVLSQTSSGSDLSAIDVFINPNSEIVSGEISYGGLAIANDLIVGNLTLTDNTYLSAYGDNDDGYTEASLIIADGKTFTTSGAVAFYAYPDDGTAKTLRITTADDNSSATLKNTGTITIADNSTVIIDDNVALNNTVGTIIIGTDGSDDKNALVDASSTGYLTLQGTKINDGTITVTNGTLDINDAVFTNTGTITVADASTLINTGTINNNGKMSIASLSLDVDSADNAVETGSINTSTLYIGSDYANADQSLTIGSLTIDGLQVLTDDKWNSYITTVAVSGDATIVAGESGEVLTVTSGLLSVGGDLTVEGALSSAITMGGGDEGAVLVSGTLINDQETVAITDDDLYIVGAVQGADDESDLTITSSSATSANLVVTGLSGGNKSFFNGDTITVTGYSDTEGEQGDLTLGGTVGDPFTTYGGTTDADVNIEAFGVLNVDSGTWTIGDLDVASTGYAYISSILNAGDVTTAGTSFYINSGATLTADSFKVTAGEVYINGALTTDSINVSAGTIAINGTVTTTSLVTTAGTTTVSGFLTISGTETDGTSLATTANTDLALDGGTITADSSIIVQAGSTDLVTDFAGLADNSTGTLKFTDDREFTEADITGIRSSLGTQDTNLLISVKNLTLSDSSVANGGVTETVADGLDLLQQTGEKQNVSTGSASGSATLSATSFAANSLVVTDDTSGTTELTVTTADNSTITLTGANGELIQATDSDGNSIATTNVDIATGSTLNLGKEGETTGSGTLGAVTLADSSSALTANNGNYVVGDITGEGTVTTDSKANVTAGSIGDDTTSVASVTTAGASTLTAGDVYATDVTVTGSSALVADSMTTTGTVTVGTEDGGNGTLIVNKNLKLDGGALYIDPDFDQDSSVVVIAQLGDSSEATEGIIASTADGNIGVGMNSKLIIGSDEATLNALLDTYYGGSTLTAEGIASAMYLKGSLEIATDMGIALIADGTSEGMTTSFDAGTYENILSVGANTLLALDVENFTESTAAISFESTSGEVTLADGSNVAVVNATSGTTYTLFDGLTSYTNSGTDNILVANLTLTGTVTDNTNGSGSDDGTVTIAVTQKSQADALGFESMDSNLYNLIGDYNASSNKLGFLESALSANNGSGVATGAATIEGASKIAVNAGVMNTASNITGLGVNNIQNRTSLIATSANSTLTANSGVLVASNDNYASDMFIAAVGDSAGLGGMKNGAAVWLQPMYQSTSADGFDSGNYKYGYDTDLYGVSVGADYTFANSFRVGAALHMGAGDSESSGSDFSYTENDFDYFGFSIYGAYAKDNFGLSADIGYTITNNDLSQKTAFGNLQTSDFDSSTFTAGVRAEYKVETSALDIIPHVGMRINYYDVDSFTTSDSTGAVFHSKSSDATTFAIPVGVSFSKDIEAANGVKVTPRADLGVQFTMGDLDVDQKVSIAGVNGTATMESEIFDPVTFMGGVGVDVAKDNLSFALDYNIGASSNVTNHQVMATFTYKF